jgi:hypothetical protein
MPVSLILLAVGHCPACQLFWRWKSTRRGTQSRGFVHRVRVAASKLHVGAGPDDEESGGLGQDVEPLEVNIAAIHDVEGARLQG